MQQSTAYELNLEVLFNPESIALVGATDKSAWSANTFANIKDSGFKGSVYLVNPRTEVVHGANTYRDLRSLPEKIDLIFVMVPTSAVLSILEEAAECGVRTAVILTAGFAETGAEGKRLEEQVVEFSKAHDLTVLGPNGNGYINASSGITPYGLPIPRPLITGSVGIILQSGALASSVLSFAQSRNVGISFLTAMGNESMMSVTDVLDYLVNDESTTVIALFLESIRDPREFARIARKALAIGKPIIALKIGRSHLSAQTAIAHTGALVGNDAVIDTAFSQLGVIRVNALEDLIITAGLLASTGPLPGPRIGVVTPSGGASEIIADRAEDEGLIVPAYAPKTVERLSEILPEYATPQNPLDVTGYIVVDRTIMRRSLEVVAEDPGIDFAVLLTELPRISPPEPAMLVDQYHASATAIGNTPIPTIPMSTVLQDVSEFSRHVQKETGFPYVLGGIEHGLRALGFAVSWSNAYRAAQDTPRTAVAKPARAVDLPDRPTGTWAEHEASRLLKKHGIPVVPSQLAPTSDAAVAAADAFGYPVVLKAVADGLGHKSEIGGVRLNLTTPGQVRIAHDEVVNDLRRSGASGINTMIQPQRGGGIEMLVGVIRDPIWGLTLAVGLGGVWVEVLKDTALRLLPADRNDVLEALEELRGISLLKGARGTEPVDMDILADVVVRIGALAFALGDRLEALEINPLLIRGDEVEALDALITWTE